MATLLFMPVLAAGCGDDGADDVRPIAEPTTTTVPVEDEIIEAYEAAGEALIEAYRLADPEHPDLLATHAGESLSDYQVDLRDLASKRWALEGTIETSGVVQSVDGDVALVRSCSHMRTQRVDSSTGTPLGDPGNVVAELDVEMERIDDTWKLVGSEQVSEECRVDQGDDDQ